jgi:hypothetical protein
MKEDAQLAEAYFKDLRDIHQTGGGVKEESYYGSLANLLNAIGKSLKPHVKCIIQLTNRGAGHPDGGLFSKEQWDQGNEQTPLMGQVPARGVIEIKPTSDDTWVTAESEQVSKYWNKYQLVLVTNYRDFVLIGKDKNGNPVKLEEHRLATSEADFWMKAAYPKKFAHEYGETFIEYLRRTMLQAAPVSFPRDLAWFLASYARTANTRIEGKDIPAMKSVRSALEAALGLKFEGDKGEHFFRSTLVQTIFYGLFSAWVLWSKKRSYTAQDVFSWHDALWELKVPVMQALFGQIVTPAHVGPLGLEDMLDWASSTLNRVDRVSFFSAFEEGKAVQYFYEPFLEAFDPELRKELGVWYTPPEIVRYMVARVDTVLKEELDIPDGLAAPSVFVLDPCCGTGSYLVEVLRHIHQTLKTKGSDALLASDLKKAALDRVFGFEILAAPFVVSHMQLGLLLQNMGAPLSDVNHERAGVYLTNALTGWEPLDPEKEKAFQAMLTGFPQLLEEQADARKVKQQVPILVILGNPPYNAFAGTATTKEERDSIAPYKEGLVRKWGVKKFNLDDPYVRFFRMAERRIVEQTGRGVVCLISNFSYLAEPSFVVMREHIVSQFHSMWIDNMNGDSRETGKRTPDGKPDPSAFSTQYNKAGIRKGTAVITLVRKTKHQDQTTAAYREFWGVNKRAELLDSVNAPAFNSQYELLRPDRGNYFSLRRSRVSKEYRSWPSLEELAIQLYNGPVERRGNSLIQFPSDIDHFALLKKYLDPDIEDDLIARLEPRFMKSSGEFRASKTRAALKGHATFDQANIVRYPFKPFDVRLAYLDPDTAPLFSRPSPQLLSQRTIHGNCFLITRDTADRDPEGPPFYFSRLICDYDCISGHARHIPVFIHSTPRPSGQVPKDQDHFLTQVEESPHTVAVNLSLSARRYLASLGISNPGADAHTAAIVWMHALAIGYSPSYLAENADGIRNDWPRIPLPSRRELLETSASLGERLATLLDTERPVSTVTVSEIRPEIRSIAAISKEGGGQLERKELAVTAGWGHTGQGGVVMPGKGRILERDYTAEERQSMVSGAGQLGLSPEQLFALLGERTFDVYLNEVAFWGNVPAKVWDCVIGGYQVIKKWLSYREADLLKRPLTTDEAREVRDMARRIAAIILLQPALDENYQKCKENVCIWPN